MAETGVPPADLPCEVCGSPRDAKSMLLCDGEGCDKAYHYCCLSPPLKGVPKDDWLCPHCTAPAAAEKKKKKKITLPLRAAGRVAPMGSWGSRGTPRP
eukprot:2192703-Pyramimonas_sp.AAC.1